MLGRESKELRLSGPTCLDSCKISDLRRFKSTSASEVGIPAIFSPFLHVNPCFETLTTLKDSMQMSAACQQTASVADDGQAVCSSSSMALSVV
jgi:hypothetical protein